MAQGVEGEWNQAGALWPVGRVGTGADEDRAGSELL